MKGSREVPSARLQLRCPELPDRRRWGRVAQPPRELHRDFSLELTSCCVCVPMARPRLRRLGLGRAAAWRGVSRAPFGMLGLAGLHRRGVSGVPKSKLGRCSSLRPAIMRRTWLPVALFLCGPRHSRLPAANRRRPLPPQGPRLLRTIKARPDSQHPPFCSSVSDSLSSPGLPFKGPAFTINFLYASIPPVFYFFFPSIHRRSRRQHGRRW